MALESVTHIDDLEVANPLGTDPRSQGDDHIRNIKVALKTDFPNINGVVSATAAELNLASGITAGTVLASKFVLVDASKKVNEWLVDNVTIDGNSITSTSGDLQLKAVSGSNLTIQDDADAAKQVTLVMSSITSGQDRAWTFPDSDGTFIGAATTDTLSNKTIAAGEFTTDLNLNDSVPIRMGTAEDSSISFDGTDLIIVTDGAGASGIILDSEDDTVEIKGSGVLQATFDAGGIDLVSGDAYEINDTVVLNATTLGGAVVASSLTSTGALNGGSITSGFGSIVNGASAITTTGTLTGGVVVADNLQLDANAITSTNTNGDITLTPHGTGSVVLDGVNWPQADGSANTYLKTNGSAQTSWVAGSPAAAVLTTHGDLVFQNSTPANARLAAGTSGQFLQTSGSGADPVWATPVPADNSVTLAKMAAGTDGNIISYDASGDPVAIATGSAGEVLTSGGAGAAPSFAAAGGAPSHRNNIINGGLVVNQENQTAPADAAYTIGDLFLHNGEGTPLMSLETDGPQGTRPWQKMVLDANAQGGLAYIVPNDTVQDYIANGKMSFGIQLKTTAATIANARIGVIKWTGTADAVTKELVGTWASDGTNPTLATSLSYENTPANLGLTTSWARHVVENVTVDADTTNIVIFVWTNDGTITASDVIGFSEWQLNPGSTVHAFSSEGVAKVADQVDYFLMRYDFNGVGDEELAAFGVNTSTSQGHVALQLRKSMRANPTFTGSAAATFRVSNVYAAAAVASSVAFNAPTRNTVQITANVSGTPFTQGDPARLTRASSSATFIQLDARIGV